MRLHLLPIAAFLLSATPAVALSPVACTQEARLCPDGVTWVGRDGPNCEFSPCPSNSCPPYQCADGTEIARCAEDGTVINYFANPCLTHGGEAISDGFFDVSSSHPNYDAILYVQKQGIVEGYSDGTFKPDQQINRAEFVKILVVTYLQRVKENEAPRWENDYCDNEDMHLGFEDTDDKAWYAFYLCTAKTHLLIQGYNDRTFRPAANINFVEAAKIIAQTFSLPSTKTDVWFEGYVRTLADNNAIPSSITRFDQLITRGEMAEMIYRLKAGVTDKESQTYEVLQNASQNGAWKTYRNENAKISFKYPSSYSIVTDEIRTTYTDGKSWYRIDLESGNGEDAASIRIEVNPDGYGPFFTDKTYILKETLQRTLRISLVKMSEPSENSDDDSLLITASADFSNENWFFSIFSASENQLAEEEIYQQVLQSVQILP